MRALFLRIAVLLLAGAGYGSAQSTTVTANQLYDGSGPLLQGQLCFVPVNSQGIPQAFSAGGRLYLPGDISSLRGALCRSVASGALTSPLMLPDRAFVTAAAPLCYEEIVINNQTQRRTDLGTRCDITGSAIAADVYTPPVTPSIPMTGYAFGASVPPSAALGALYYLTTTNTLYSGGTDGQFHPLSGGSGGGSTPVFAIGSVSTGPAAASLTGSATNPILNLTLPAGAPGAPGAAGTPGTPGAAGTPGTPGTPGATPSVTVNSVATLAAGAQATVAVDSSSTSSNVRLNFGIPQGPAGSGNGSGINSIAGGAASGLVVTVANPTTNPTVTATVDSTHVLPLKGDGSQYVKNDGTSGIPQGGSSTTASANSYVTSSTDKGFQKAFAAGLPVVQRGSVYSGGPDTPCSATGNGLGIDDDIYYYTTFLGRTECYTGVGSTRLFFSPLSLANGEFDAQIRRYNNTGFGTNYGNGKNGTAGTWRVGHADEQDVYASASGIQEDHSNYSLKTAGGDYQMYRDWMYYSGGGEDASGEKVDHHYIWQEQNPTYVANLSGTVAKGASTVMTVGGNGCGVRGAPCSGQGRILLRVAAPLYTGQVTAITGPSLSSSGTMTTAFAVTPSPAFGTVGNIPDSTDRDHGSQQTITVTITGGTSGTGSAFRASGVACITAGSQWENVHYTSTAVSGGQQTLTLLDHTQPLVDGVEIYDGGAKYLNAPIDGTLYGRSAYIMFGATDAHTIRWGTYTAGARAGGPIANDVSKFRVSSHTAIYPPTLTRAANGAVTYSVGNLGPALYQWAGLTPFVTNCTDGTFNGGATGPIQQSTDGSTLTFPTSATTTGSCANATILFGGFDQIEIFEGARTHSNTNAAIPPSSNSAIDPRVDGTLNLEANEANWVPGEQVEQAEDPNVYVRASSEYYHKRTRQAGYQAALHEVTIDGFDIFNQTSFQGTITDYLGFGGWLKVPTAMVFAGNIPTDIYIDSLYQPTKSFLHVRGTNGSLPNTTSQPSYFIWDHANHGLSYSPATHTLTLDPNITLSATIAGGGGGNASAATSSAAGTVQLPAGATSNVLAPSATIDTTNAAGVTSGVFAAARMPTSSVFTVNIAEAPYYGYAGPALAPLYAVNSVTAGATSITVPNCNYINIGQMVRIDSAGANGAPYEGSVVSCSGTTMVLGQPIVTSTSNMALSLNTATTMVTAATAAGATTLPVTSCSFFPARHGVYIGGTTPYIGQYTSCSGTTMTITPALPNAVAANAVVQHDETLAFTSAIANNIATYGNLELIVPSGGRYAVNGPVQDASGANAIIAMPKVGYQLQPPVSVRIKGTSKPLVEGGYDAHAATIATSLGNGANLFGGSNVHTTAGGIDYPPFTNVHFEIDNIQIEGYYNPNFTAVDARNIAAFMGHDLGINPGPDFTTADPTYQTWGIRMPTLANNNKLELDGVNIVGFYNSASLTEHLNAGAIHSFYAHNGFVLDLGASASVAANAPGYVGNSIHVAHMDVMSAHTAIAAGVAVTPVVIDSADFELISEGICYDPSNRIQGMMHYYLSYGTSQAENYTGCANLSRYNMNTNALSLAGTFACGEHMYGGASTLEPNKYCIIGLNNNVTLPPPTLNGQHLTLINNASYSITVTAGTGGHVNGAANFVMGAYERDILVPNPENVTDWQQVSRQ